MIRILAIALAVTGLLLAVTPQTTSAQTASPDVFMLESTCYRNLAQDGDLYCIARLQLPISDTSATIDAWCAELEDTTDCDAMPPDPDVTSFQLGKALTSLYTNCTGGPPDCSAGVLESQSNIPRIGHTLGGVYLEPGHSVTWADTSAAVCVESSPTFVPSNIDCVVPTWNTAASDPESQKDQFESDIKGPTGIMINLQSALILPVGTLINGVNLITPAGRVYAIEALNVMDRIVPGAFQVGVNAVIDSTFSPDSTNALQTSLDATAAATGLSASLENQGQHIFGISGPQFATYFTLLMSVMVGGLFYQGSGKPIVGIAAFMSLAMLGLFYRGPTFSVMAVSVILLAMGAGWYLIGRRAPS